MYGNGGRHENQLWVVLAFPMQDADHALVDSFVRMGTPLITEEQARRAVAHKRPEHGCECRAKVHVPTSGMGLEEVSMFPSKPFVDCKEF